MSWGSVIRLCRKVKRRIRVQMSAAHTHEQLEQAVAAFAKSVGN